MGIRPGLDIDKNHSCTRKASILPCLYALHLGLDFIEQCFQLVHIRLLSRPLDTQSLRLIRFRNLHTGSATVQATIGPAAFLNHTMWKCTYTTPTRSAVQNHHQRQVDPATGT